MHGYAGRRYLAWFTDTASTGVNEIQAGKLDVALEMKDAAGKWVSAEGETLDFVKAAGAENEAILWEPGCTYTLPELRVVNNGNLALKYKVVITGIRGDAELNKAIEWTMAFDGAATPWTRSTIWRPRAERPWMPTCSPSPATCRSLPATTT